MSAHAHTGGPEAAELNCFIISERSRKNISLLPNNRLGSARNRLRQQKMV